MRYTYRLIVIAMLMLSDQSVLATVYQKPEAFLQQAFAGDVPQPKMLWISGELRARAEQILQHRPATLRTRYWQQANRTAWILEEIGKEQPITVGIIINDNRIESVKVLIFRESRGWEVKHPFFTNQFKEVQLQPDLQLDKNIDGITGATLSVRAVTKLIRLALYFHQQIKQTP